MMFSDYIVTLPAQMSPTGQGLQSAGADSLPMRTGAPVIVDGVHCPACGATMYEGRRAGSVVCLTHGDYSDDVYRTLWLSLNVPTTINKADRSRPASIQS